ncbi:MAG: gamma-glutamyltransferase [Labilithrix sp.]|nr:gamma-glutamyltransferase [Labilithrix sp.]
MTTHGVVAAGDPQTAEAGASVLAQGGNAIDAAVAAAFAAFVCEMPLCSPLGGGVLLADLDGGARAVDMFARAPGLGTAPRRLDAIDFHGVEVSFGAATQIFHVGRGSAAVPLALPGLLDVHRRWGSLPLADVLAPAVKLGRDGYVLGPGVAYVFSILEPIARLSAECLALYRDGDALAKAGARLDNRDLARTLEDLGRNPAHVRDLFAALADEHGPARGGLVTAEDVEAAAVADIEPVRVRYAGWDLATMPGPSTGGVLVALGMRLLEGISSTRSLSREHLLGVAKVQETLLAQRDEHFDARCRDPRWVRDLLDEERIAALRAETRAAAIAAENRLGSTTHISVLDDRGAAAALTLTNGEGCGHVLSGTGMVVNNLLGEHDLHPRGFHLDAPGSALATMMAPTLLRRDGDRIALGSGGSNRLRNAIMQVLVGIVEHGVSPEAAVSAPRLQLEMDRAKGRPHLAFESTGLAADVVDALAATYPDAPAIFTAPNLYFGGVHVALRTGGRFGGVGDPRRGGAAVVR